MKSVQIYRCPSDTNSAIPTSADANTSYAINLVGKNEKPMNNPNSCPFGRGDNGNTGALTISALETPSTTIMVADNASNNAYQNPQNWADLNQAYNQINTAVTPRTLGGNWSERHLDTINTLFCDGHVKAVKLSYFVQPTTAGTKATHLTIGADPE